MKKLSKTKDIPCRECGKLFSEEDVFLLNLYGTRVCHKCYEAGVELPHRAWCFGKPNTVKKGKVVEFGYDPSVVECSTLCPHRRVCKVFVLGKIDQVRAKRASIIKQGGPNAN